MKIKGKSISAPNISILVIPRENGDDIVFKAQAVLDMEKREKDGSITIKSLKEIGRALDMQLVYGFVSKHESLEQMVEKRANEIVMRTNSTMTLEDQKILRKESKKHCAKNE